MRLIKPSIEFLDLTDQPLKMIEMAARTCYKSERRITNDSAKKLVKYLINRKHFAMIEHAHASYRVITDRGVTHEIVRHRLFSYAQESTRYCNYSKAGDEHISFILPPWVNIPEGIYREQDDPGVVPNIDTGNSFRWFVHMLRCEQVYLEYTRSGYWKPEQARSVLPNSLKTEIVITGNLREWRHFFKLRTHKTAHPQIQEVANILLKDIKSRVPVIFDDVSN